MSKQIKKISAIFLALALFCMSFAVTSSALYDPGQDPINTGIPFSWTIKKDNDGNDIPITEAAIAKTLNTPVGTVLPADLEFEFTIVPENFSGIAYDNSNMPTLGTAGVADISITSASNPGSYGDTDTYWAETADLLAIDWSSWADGVYVYTITETNGTFTPSADPLVDEILSNSKAEYSMSVFVEGGVVVAVAAKYIKDHTGGTAGGYKVDPTPGGGTELGHDFSQMIFNNQYVKYENTDPEDPGFVLATAPLAISKAVTGEYAKPDDEFDFTATITMPTLVENNDDFLSFRDPYVAYLFENGALVDDPAVVTVSFESGTAQTFKLKGTQSLVFANLPVGATFTVTEEVAAGYVPSVVIDGTAIAGKYNTALSTGTKYVLDPEIGYNLAAYTNDASTTPPTGLNLNTVPFYAMIVLAISAMGVYLVAKTRKGKAQQF